MLNRHDFNSKIVTWIVIVIFDRQTMIFEHPGITLTRKSEGRNKFTTSSYKKVKVALVHDKGDWSVTRIDQLCVPV